MSAPANTAAVAAKPAARGRLAETAWRYSLSASGPVAIAAAHFLASLIVLRVASPEDFGRFAFILVIVPLAMSMSSALLGAPIAGALNKGRAIDAAEMASYLKTNAVFSALAGLVTFGLFLASHGAPAVAFTMALYSGAMTLRWFARSLTYAEHKPLPAVLSDLAYSVLVLAILAALLLAHRLSLLTAALALLVAAAAGAAVFGKRYFGAQLASLRKGSLGAYVPVWQELTRFSLAGVVLTEFTSNAHAYVVTFLAGPKAFALLAVGTLLMRPVGLVLTALPDLERPVMARRLAAGDVAGALRSVNEFRTAAGAVLLATILLAASVLVWFPHLLIKPGYDKDSVVAIVAAWVVIQAVRVLRTPDAVLLQAAQEFSGLAKASARSCAISLVATPVLLLLAGPVASLGGILLGDVVVTWNVFALSRDLRRRHG